MATLGGRPVSAKGRNRPTSAGKVQAVKTNSDGVSYEDLLVAQYLEELRKSQQYGRPQSSQAQSSSPYLQRLAHTHIVPTPNLAHRRPQSAYTASGKPRVDAKYIDDPELWEPTSPRAERKKRRPASAPVYKRPRSVRPLSATYGGRPGSAKSGRFRTRALYRKQPHIIVVTAFRNGTRDNFVRVTAPNIKMLLEHCTEKLGFPNAARRVFLDDGTEVFTAREIQRDSEVFISTGEPFKNPFRGVKQQTEVSKTATWTMNGVVWTSDTKKKSTKPALSKRFRNLISQSRRRVLVFKNGHGSQGVEIVTDPDRFEDFLVACTAKCDLGSYARILYDWEGREVNSLENAPVLDQCLQTWSTPVLGPLWVSKGEGFSPKGVSDFLSGLITYTKAKLKEAKHYRKQLQYGQHHDTKDKVEIVAILSMSEQEIEETIQIVDKDIEDFSNALNRLKEQIEKINAMLSEEANEGYGYQLKHIEKIDSEHRMVGTKGIRLKVFENGTYEAEALIYFNVAAATRGISNDKDAAMARLLDQCSNNTFLMNPKKNPAIRPIAKKLYDRIGNEITNVYELENDTEVWLSYGEPWRNPFSYVMTAQFDRVKVFERQGAIKVVKETLMTEEITNRERSTKWDVLTGMPEDVEHVPDPEADSYPEVVGMRDSTETDDAMPLPTSSAASNEIKMPETATFLQCKEDGRVLITPSLVVDVRKKKKVPTATLR